MFLIIRFVINCRCNFDFVKYVLIEEPIYLNQDRGIIVDQNRELSRWLVFDILVLSAVAGAPGVPIAQSLKCSISCDGRD